MEMPHSEIDEVILIGSILQSKTDFYEIINQIPADAFFIQEHHDIYKHLEILQKHGYKPTPGTLIEILKENNLLEACHGEKFIRNLMLHASVKKDADIKIYAGRILSLYNKRKLLKLASDIKREVSSSDDIYELKKRYMQMLSSVDDVHKEGFVSAEAVMSDFQEGKTYLETVDDRIYCKTNGIDPFQGFRTGYTTLDEYMGGFGNGFLTIVGARSGSGKTTLLANLMLINKELYPDSRIGFFTLEMSAQSIIDKLAATHAGIIFDNLVEGDLTFDERKRIADSDKFLRNSGFYFYDKPGLSVSKAFALLRKHIINDGLQMVFIDYLTIIKPDKETGNIYQDTDNIAKSLFAMSREFKIPFVSLAQLSRKSTDRPNKTPMVSDLRNAGSVEEVADNVILMHRPAMYDKTRVDFTELHLEKNRYRSRTVKINLKYDRGRLWEIPPIENEIKNLGEIYE